MTSLRDIKHRIQSIENIRKITKAMKMISTVKLKRSQDALVRSRLYYTKLERILENVLSTLTNDDMKKYPILRENKNKNNVNLLVITANKGLCGAFNSALVKESKILIEKFQKTYKNITIESFGKKAYAGLKHIEGIKLINFQDAWIEDSFKMSKKIATQFYEQYQNNTADSIWVVGNSFKSVMSQKLTVQEIIPIQSTLEDTEKKDIEFDYEPSKHEILDFLIPKYFIAYIYKLLLESFTSEQAARMQAMENASKSAKETFDILKIQYNRIRQANITRELIEIISGAESLK
jgi:F-type H+-transporting ATPase subunit gamma